jgi:hypothetical protein
VDERNIRALESLVVSARAELQKDGSDYGVLLHQLQLLAVSLNANEVPETQIESLWDALHAKLRPKRAGTPTAEGLKETRALWAELNRIVKSRKETNAPQKVTKPAKSK